MLHPVVNIWSGDRHIGRSLILVSIICSSGIYLLSVDLEILLPRDA